jgi:hypothetical protein
LYVALFDKDIVPAKRLKMTALRRKLIIPPFKFVYFLYITSF